MELTDTSLGDNIGSNDQTKNPAFYDFTKGSTIWILFFKIEIISLVFVPYCSSDVYSGTKDASADTGNLVFHGKILTGLAHE